MNGKFSSEVIESYWGLGESKSQLVVSKCYTSFQATSLVYNSHMIFKSLRLKNHCNGRRVPLRRFLANQRLLRIYNIYTRPGSDQIMLNLWRDSNLEQLRRGCRGERRRHEDVGLCRVLLHVRVDHGRLGRALLAGQQDWVVVPGDDVDEVLGSNATNVRDKQGARNEGNKEYYNITRIECLVWYSLSRTRFYKTLFGVAQHYYKI